MNNQQKNEQKQHISSRKLTYPTAGKGTHLQPYLGCGYVSSHEGVCFEFVWYNLTGRWFTRVSAPNPTHQGFVFVGDILPFSWVQRSVKKKHQGLRLCVCLWAFCVFVPPFGPNTSRIGRHWSFERDNLLHPLKPGDESNEFKGILIDTKIWPRDYQVIQPPWSNLIPRLGGHVYDQLKGHVFQPPPKRSRFRRIARYITLDSLNHIFFSSAISENCPQNWHNFGWVFSSYWRVQGILGSGENKKSTFQKSPRVEFLKMMDVYPPGN